MVQERLQKLIAAAGVTSRRKAEVLIRDGHVLLNGVVVTELGTKADPAVDEGTHGLIALGSFGQFLSITDEERTAIVESFVGQAAGRAPVIVGTMDARTENAVRYSKEAEALGADGIMVAPPYYYTPTDDEIFAYYKEISEAVSIPIMLYNNPFTTNVDMSAALVARLTKAFENVLSRSSSSLAEISIPPAASA